MASAAVVAALGLAVMPLAANGEGGRAPDRVKSLTTQLVNGLKGRYQVALGYPRLYTNADCDTYSYPIMKSCFGNNPAAPYILPIAPTWPQEYVDPALRNAFGATGRGYSTTYRLDPREAIVVLGMLPPAGRYTGIQTYLATRKGAFDRTSPTYQVIASRFPSMLGILFATLPRDASRIESFSSLGNSVNNVVVERRSGASFGTLKALVITPDKTMDGVVRKELARIGIPSKDVFTEPIASAGFHLGLGKSADDFVTVIRYAMPDDPKAGNAWRRTLPLSVVRVREVPASKRAPLPYPTPALATRSATPEAEYGGAVAALADAVCGRWGACGDRKALNDLQAPPINLVGPACRAIGMNCLADTQDTTYIFSTDLGLDQGEVYAVLGTLATETGNATYVGLSVNESSKLEGVANIDDARLKGSAASYATVPDREKLFVYYLARSCAGLQSLTGGRCLSVTTDMVPTGGSLKIGERTYVRPGTERGPDSTQLLKPIVMKVTRPSAG